VERATLAIIPLTDDLMGLSLRSPPVRLIKLSFRITVDAVRHLIADDGWAIASHIALSTLMALFPFLIVVTALAGLFFGSKDLADEAARILLEAWPPEVAGPIANDVARVLTQSQGGVLTFGALFATYFASSGVEGLRIGLNRAYGTSEMRAFWLLRLESIFYVLVGAIAILSFSFGVVLAPLIWAKLVEYVPAMQPFDNLVTIARYAVAAVVLIIALVILHKWLPAGKRTFTDVAPGIAATLLLWLVAGAVFGRYLAQFAGAYTTMYAGLASAMIALVFLYMCAIIFIFGAELNAVIAKARAARANS
jgi:membrane protein